MKAPETIEEIFERKKRARRRYDNLSLFAKMQIAIDLSKDVSSMFGKARRLSS